jgi:inositol transport system ATP-binding protein
VIAISSELPEVLAISDRIVTMREGRITGGMPRDQATEEVLMHLMTIEPPALNGRNTGFQEPQL